jgi:predicted O-methyltransferase YrrM
VDTNAAVQQIARESFGKDKRLKLVTSDALQFLRTQAPAAFDLVFADSMPGKYEGLAEALAVVKPGGFYVIDDMLPQANWPAGHAAKVPVLMEQLAHHPAFRILPMVWASGVVVAVRTSR